MPRTNMHSLQCYTEGMIGTAGLGRDEPAAALASEALHLGAHFGRRDRKKQATGGRCVTPPSSSWPAGALLM